MNTIGILDIGIGNLGSLNSALSELGFESVVVRSPEVLHEVDSLIMPGVGAFGHGMQSIKSSGMENAIRTHVAASKPLLGICLGMQMLFDGSEESSSFFGLGLIPGGVKRFAYRQEYQVPHVGWNNITTQKQHFVLRGLKAGIDFYFVHSYYVECDSAYVVSVTDYGINFPSIVSSGSVIGIQFHPEKSQRNGLKILSNFCLWDGKC